MIYTLRLTPSLNQLVDSASLEILSFDSESGNFTLHPGPIGHEGAKVLSGFKAVGDSFMTSIGTRKIAARTPPCLPFARHSSTFKPDLSDWPL